MADERTPEQEMERLQGMHAIVEKLRSQLNTIKLRAPAVETRAPASPPPRGQQTGDGSDRPT